MSLRGVLSFLERVLRHSFLHQVLFNVLKTFPANKNVFHIKTVPLVVALRSTAVTLSMLFDQYC